MRGPDRLRARIVAAERRRIAERRQRTAGEGRVDPRPRLVGARPAETPETPNEEDDEPEPGGRENADELVPGEDLREPEGEQRPQRRQRRAERPECAGETLERHCEAGPAQDPREGITSAPVSPLRSHPLRFPAPATRSPSGVRAQPVRNGIPFEHFVKAGSRPHHGIVIAVHQHLGHQRPRVVLRRHHRAVGPGRAEGDEIAGVERRQRPRRGRRCRRSRRPDRRRRPGPSPRPPAARRAARCRARRRTSPAAPGRSSPRRGSGSRGPRRACGRSPGEQDAGVAGDQPPGLDVDLAAEMPDGAPHHLAVVDRQGRSLVRSPVGDAEPAAEIEPADVVAVGAQRER